MRIVRQPSRLVFIFGLGLVFFFRCAFGLCSEFWTENSDQEQIFLIGLKYYATGAWPFFGPDVASGIQIPGALQGLVAGLPFHVFRIPEAPYIILNILSFASLCFFAWYCQKRLPELPHWFVWSWLMTAPWTMNLSTQVVNPSYVLPAAILFFIGAIESYPFLTRNLISPRWANFMMGLATFWIMQFHLSWVVLVPFTLLSFYFQFRKDGLKALVAMKWFALGAIVPVSVLLPTFIKFGLAAGMGNTMETVQFNLTNLVNQLNIVEGILGRFLSFASFELPRFIGQNTAARLQFIRENLWLTPAIIFLTLVGVLQPVALLILWFRRGHTQADWKAIKYLTFGTVLLLYVSFLFSMKAPSSHTFYVTFPVAMLYSLYCWSEFLSKRGWQKFALAVISCGIIFNVGLALHTFRNTSLYVDRTRILEAIRTRDYHVVGERRSGSRY